MLPQAELVEAKRYAMEMMEPKRKNKHPPASEYVCSPVRDTSPHFKLFPEFSGASYAERYNIMCRKQEQL